MKMVLTLIFIICMLEASAQEYGTVKGKVVNGKTNEEAGLAQVLIMNLSDYTFSSTKSDFDGEYSFDSIPYGDYMLAVNHLGYYYYRTIFCVSEIEEDMTIHLQSDPNLKVVPLTTITKPLFDFKVFDFNKTTYTQEYLQRMPYR